MLTRIVYTMTLVDLLSSPWETIPTSYLHERPVDILQSNAANPVGVCAEILTGADQAAN